MDVDIAMMAALTCSPCARGFFKPSVGGSARTIYI